MTEERNGQKIVKAMGNQVVAQIALSQIGKRMPGYTAPLATFGNDITLIATDPRTAEAARQLRNALAEMDPKAVAAARSLIGEVVDEYLPPTAVAQKAATAVKDSAFATAGVACFGTIVSNPAIHAAIAGAGLAALPLEVLFVGATALGCSLAATKGAEMVHGLTAQPVLPSMPVRSLADRSVGSLH